MDQTKQFFASMPLEPLPLLYRDPARTTWPQFAARAGECSNALYKIESLVPNTYATQNAFVHASTLEYAAIALYLDPGPDFGTPSAWSYMTCRPETARRMQVSELDEERFVAAYNVAASCTQMAAVLYSRRYQAQVLDNVMRLMLVAQRVLRSLHEIRKQTDPVDSGGVVLCRDVDGDGRSDAGSPPPAAVDAAALNVLATFVHGQLAELQLERRAATEDGSEPPSPSEMAYVASVFQACRDALDAMPERSARVRLGVVSGKLARLVAVKRHLAHAVAAHLFTQQVQGEGLLSGACAIARRYAREARKSTDKTKPTLSKDSLLEQLASDPLANVRRLFVEQIEALDQECSALGAPDVDEARVQEAWRALCEHGPDRIQYKLSEPCAWATSDFCQNVYRTALRCREEIVVPGAPLIVPEKSVAALSRQLRGSAPAEEHSAAPAKATAEEDTLPSIIERLRRLYILHERVGSLSRQQRQHADDVRVDATMQALIALTAIAKAVLFRRFDVACEEFVYVGKLAKTRRLDEATRRLAQLPLKELRRITPHLGLLDDSLEHMRQTIKQF